MSLAVRWLKRVAKQQEPLWSTRIRGTARLAGSPPGKGCRSDKNAQPTKISSLESKNLKVFFTLKKGGFGRTPVVVRAVDGLSFKVRRGSTYGIVGESGCGKSTTAMAVMRLTPLTSGDITFEGIELSTLAGTGLRNFRRNLQIIFQDPYSSLDPRRRAGNIVREPLDRMGIGSKKEREEWITELFHRVGLRPEQAQLFPHQFSGGQRQRIGIARALSSRPKLIVCDEPVSALDVAIQAQILNLLMELQKEFGLTYLFISHDLGVIKYMCDDISVMYLGRIMEEANRYGPVCQAPTSLHQGAAFSGSFGRFRKAWRQRAHQTRG